MLSHFNSEGARATRKLAERESRIISGYLQNTDREVRATAARLRKWAEGFSKRAENRNAEGQRSWTELGSLRRHTETLSLRGIAGTLGFRTRTDRR
jgi:hypothetical protein